MTSEKYSVGDIVYFDDRNTWHKNRNPWEITEIEKSEDTTYRLQCRSLLGRSYDVVEITDNLLFYKKEDLETNPDKIELAVLLSTVLLQLNNISKLMNTCSYSPALSREHELSLEATVLDLQAAWNEVNDVRAYNLPSTELKLRIK